MLHLAATSAGRVPLLASGLLHSAATRWTSSPTLQHVTMGELFDANGVLGIRHQADCATCGQRHITDRDDDLLPPTNNVKKE